MELCASVVYISISILLCAFSARNSEIHQYREFVAKSELERVGSVDYLTNTANRFKMEEEAGRWIDFCHRQGYPLALVFIDIDDLKTINDRFGHNAGDSVLMNMTHIIRSQIRNTDILARWGGDEFVLLMPNMTLDNAIGVSERIRSAIINNNFTKGIRVTCSFGVVAMKDGSVFQNLIEEADTLMYTGKKLGKNNVQWIRQ